MSYSLKRPDYISPSWFRCNQGMELLRPPPESLMSDHALASSNLWERVVCVLLQARSGDFRNTAALLEVVALAGDPHLRDCAINLFAFCAPRGLLPAIGDIYTHPSSDTRLEAYAATSLTGSLVLVVALSRHRRSAAARERERVMDALSEVLEARNDELVIVDSDLPDADFEALVDARVTALRQQHGDATAIRHAAPLDANVIAAEIAEMCEDDDPTEWGGAIASSLSLLEAMTGLSYAGCLDETCTPDIRRVSHTLNMINQSGALRRFVPGRRYFRGFALDEK